MCDKKKPVGRVSFGTYVALCHASFYGAEFSVVFSSLFLLLSHNVRSESIRPTKLAPYLPRSRGNVDKIVDFLHTCTYQKSCKKISYRKML